MFLVSDTNLTLAFAIAAGLAALLAIAALVLYGRAAAARASLASRLNQLERGADHTERRMFQILNSIPVALVETDTSGRFVFANKAAHGLLGRKDAELIGLRFHSATWGITYPDGKLIPPDLLPAARALRGQTVRGFQHLIINPNTRKRILVSVTAMPVTNDLGEVIGSTAAMVETEGLVEQIVEIAAPPSPWVELSGEALLALDPDGKVLEISRGGARLLGRERGDIEGRDWFDFLPEDDRAQAREQFQALVEGRVEPTADGEAAVLAADGAVRRLSWRTDVLRDDEGRARAVLAAGREAVEAPVVAPTPEAEPAPAAPAEDPRFVSLAAAAEEALWTADAESGRLTYVSPAFTRLYGFTLEELAADISPWMANVDAEDRPAVQAAWEAAIAGETREAEFRWTRAGDAEPRRIRDRLFPIRDGEGRVVGAGGAARDVSEQTDGAAAEAEAAAAAAAVAAETEAALRESQALLQGLFETPGVQIGVMESLGDDVRFTAANAAVDQLFGRPVEGATARDLGLTPEEIADWTATIEGAQTRGAAALVEQPVVVGGREAGWRLAACAPLPRSPEGRARATFVAVDISERRKGEAALRDSEARARALAEAAPQLVWSSTPSGWCDYLNPRWVEYTGVPAERHYGLGWQEAIHPEDRARAAAAWSAAVDGEGDDEIDYRLRAADGSYRWFRARSAAQRDEAGQVVRRLGVATDVTAIVAAKAELEQRAAELEQSVAEREAELERALDDQRKTEAALVQAQRLETVGRLTGGVAHDFNNLLTVMIGALDIIERHADKADRVRRLSEAALTAGRRGERLTRQLLAFSRRQEFEPQTVDLARLIHGFEPLVRRALGEGVPFALEMPDDLGAARIDPVQFEAALLNLIVNAKDAVETGGAVTLRAERVRLESGQVVDLGDGDYLRVAIVDSGVGMTAEVAARALEPFFTTKEAGKGTGLGLAQVYGFARQSGGQVQIDTAPGAGASVSLWLPAAEAGAVEPADDADEARTPEPDATALLAEDDTDALQVARS